MGCEMVLRVLEKSRVPGRGIGMVGEAIFYRMDRGGLTEVTFET